MELIGKGTFSKVYKLNEKQVLIKSVCYAKECISLNMDSKWFPKLERTDYNEYICEYYPKVKSLKETLKPNHYKIYQELRKLNVYCANSYDYLDAWRKEFKKVSNTSVKNALLEMLDDLANYGTEIGFEISPRNVAVKDGNLVLLDVFYMRDQLDSVRKMKLGCKKELETYNN